MCKLIGNSFDIAFLIIGDEILSGRTQDTNLKTLADTVGQKGYVIKEVNIVPDFEEAIIASINILRKKYSFVFTSGGIGPTHDDITSESISKAFKVPYKINNEAEQILVNYYKALNYPFNEARRKMAKMPVGASLIKNNISAAPGFKLENVYVLAGVPAIFKSMLEEIVKTLPKGAKMYSINLILKEKSEGEIAGRLSLLQNKYLSKVFIGSYPFFNQEQGRYNIELVFKSMDKKLAMLSKKEAERIFR